MHVSLDAAEWALNRCVLEGQKLKISYADDPKSDKVDETDGKALGVLETGRQPQAYYVVGYPKWWTMHFCNC